MTVTPPFTIRWGIISTGQIATEFTQDLLVDPATRAVTDVAHQVAAVGSRSVASAEKFINTLKSASSTDHWSWGVGKGMLDTTKAYGSYQEVYSDPSIDIIYIATPVTHHHKDAKAALLAGKHVLCEKPFTYDVAELDELIAIATDKKLFLMEAVWTRFHPISYAVQDVIKSGVLGRPKRFSADFSKDFSIDSRPVSDRFLDPELGGGSLLDMGPYPSVWAMLILHQHPENPAGEAPVFRSSYQRVYKRTNVDSRSRWLLEWETLGCEAQLMTDMTCQGFKEGTALVQCEEGDLIIDFPPQKPDTFHIVPHDEVNGVTKRSTQVHKIPESQGHGLCFEADEVARCLRDGKVESARMPLSESRIVQDWFDQVRLNGETALKNFKGTAGVV